MTGPIDNFQMIDRVSSENALVFMLLFPAKEQFDKVKEMFIKQNEIRDRVMWKTLLENAIK